MSDHPPTSTTIDALLYGTAATPGIVAVEPAGRDGMRVYRRATGAAVEVTTQSFRPWLLLERAPSWPGARDDCSVSELAGAGDYRYLVRFTHWPAFVNARQALHEAGIAWTGFRSPVEQHLAATGQTLFQGLAFDDLVRLQLDIETTSLDPGTAGAAIFLVTVGSNRGHEFALGGDGADEATLLRQLNALIGEIDPDVIEGHNIFNFDLPYLLARGAACGVALNWGRDGSPLTPGQSQRFKVGARTIPFTPHYAYGRHLLDTYQQIQRYDAGGNLTSYGLKEAIDALGFTRGDRTFLPGDELLATWQTDRAAVVRYALDDIRDVALLSALTAPTEFYQTQILPWSFQSVATGGTGAKVNALVLRTYLAAGAALPRPEPPRAYPGGYSEVREVGIFRPVVKCDVESLYPAIMLTEGIGSKNDHLGILLPLLGELTRRRLAAKEQARRASGRDKAYWQGLQSSFKVLINSFYGYLGYSRALLNDYDAAERITLRGQALIKRVVAELERTGARVIEIDTDGVYFVPPGEVTTREEEARYIARVGTVLPRGINLAHDGRFQGMISLKMKNYVLMDEDGGLILKGSSLRSRRDEPFLRRFLYAAAAAYISGSRDRARELYFETARRLQRHEFPPRDFCRWETISEKTFHSESNRRLAAVARGERVGERLAVYQRADGSLGLLANYQRDEDVNYLLQRLQASAARFADLYDDPDDFAYAFPLLTATSDLDARQAATPVKQLTLF